MPKINLNTRLLEGKKSPRVEIYPKQVLQKYFGNPALILALLKLIITVQLLAFNIDAFLIFNYCN